VTNALAERLLRMYEAIRRPDWKWFENIPGVRKREMPQALLLVGSACPDDRMSPAVSNRWIARGNATLHNQRPFVPIGSQAFIVRVVKKARSINNRLRPGASIRLSACLRITGDSRCASKPGRVQLVLGRHDLQRVYDSVTGGCRDGFIPSAPNEIRERNRRCRS